MGELAGRQSGRVSWPQLEQLGIGKACGARWVAQGYLHRVHPGVYAVGHRAPTIEGELAAAVLYAGPGAMLSDATALWWFALLDRRPPLTEVSTPGRRRSLPGLRVHDRRNPSRIWHRGLPITPVALALRDYAATAPLDNVRRALAEAEYRRLLDLEAVRAVLGHGRPGAARLRAAIARHEPRLALTRSALEQAFLALCVSARLPLPEVNPIVEGMMVDMMWRAQRVIVELDGHDGHDSRAQIERDRGRELRLRKVGFLILRYTWEQITSESKLVRVDLRAALGRA